MGIFGLSLYFSLIMCQVLEVHGELSASVVYSLLSTKLNAIELNTHTLQLSVSKLEKRIGDLEKLITSDQSGISTDRQTNKHDTVETLHATKTSLLQAFKQEKSYIRSFLAEQDKQQQQLRSLVGDQLELINVTYDRQFTELRATVDEQFNYLNISQDKKITELRATVDEQFNYLNVSMDTTNKTTSTLSTQINEFIDTINKHMKERFTQLGTDLSNQVSAINAVKESVFKTLEGKRIGFTAWLGDDMISSLFLETVVFDNIVTNIGGGYNGLTGIFTAPVSGLYMFHVTVMAYDDNHTAGAFIRIGGILNALALAHSDMRRTGTNSVVGYMNAGQKAFVSMGWGVGYGRNGIKSDPYGTTFTGALIN